MQDGEDICYIMVILYRPGCTEELESVDYKLIDGGYREIFNKTNIQLMHF